MNLFTRIACYLVRRLGGEHKWRRVTVMVSTSNGIATSKTRECTRCGHAIAVRHRAPKPVSAPLFTEE